ncbi:DUF4350 domain-containing protein [Nocardioides sp.]|uniref:DUF4350 domain-containing protein n=1 Tax=Nocardioides sp. TaxID=35761 RepID=UPI00286BCAD6|nr:DUF4350 domain-containing protein [Nocardioides sp.]
MTGLLRRHRAVLLITLGLLAAVAVVVWSGQGGRTAEDLDPANPGPSGAQALASVLDDQGVDVEVARGADALDDTAVDTDTTVVVTSTDALGRSTVERLLSAVGDARLVLVAPGPGVTEAVGLGGQPSSSTLGSGTRGACADPSYDALVLEVDTTLAYPAAGGCFRTDDGDAVLVERDGVVSFGAGDALTNDQVLRADNAAVALRLLGEDERLVWYVPSVADLVGDDGVSLTSLLPDSLVPGLWLVGLSTVALVLWRVRRLGPLSTEPLPVVVKAIETTLSRGRLYRRAGDRAHAAAALRRAARTRAAQRLRLGATTEDRVLVRDLARHLDRPVDEVAALLAPDAPTPASDAALITLADQLAELDREVRRT